MFLGKGNIVVIFKIVFFIIVESILEFFYLERGRRGLIITRNV